MRTPHERRVGRAAAVAFALGGLVLAAQDRTAPRPVTEADLIAGFKSPERWLTFHGDYTGQRHSPLSQLTPQNVAGLVPQWIFQAETPGLQGRAIEATPLVADGVIYLTGNFNEAYAIDARTGRALWRYRRALSQESRAYVCCGPANRGFAILGDRLFMQTLDAHLVALDRTTGKVVFDVAVETPTEGYSATAAPIVVKDKVIVNVSGGDRATRGFIDAYDARTGRHAWRFYIVPGPGEPGFETWPNWEAASRGGGNAWNSATYDPALNLVYMGTGNPNPDYDGAARPGDNLYTASIVALDADTGKLKWHYQFTPHDTHDWDSAHVPVLADVNMRGRLRKVVMVANRNSFFYVLDRATGELLLAKPFTDNQNWAREIGPDGRPVVLNDGFGPPSRDTCLQDGHGGTTHQPPSYDPARRLFFVTAHETCAGYTAVPETRPARPGFTATAGNRRNVEGTEQFAALRAIDPATGERKWEHRYRSYPWTVALDLTGGIMTTASGLLFTGDNDGYFMALDSATGKMLWKFQTGGPLWGSAPMTYMLDGRQWVLTTAGLTLNAFALPGQAPSPSR